MRCGQFGSVTVLDMRKLCLAVLVTFLYWRIVRTDEDLEVDQHYQSYCRKIAFPGFPKYYLTAAGDNWFIRACPVGFEFMNSMCACKHKNQVLTIQRQQMPQTTTAATTTTTTTTIQPIRRPENSLKRSVTTTNTTTTSTTTATTTTATASTVTAAEKVSAFPTKMTTREKQICEGCKLERGVGYVHHESDCDKYVMCYPIDTNGTLKGEIRQCSVGQYWDQSALTCRSSTEVTCKTDKCSLNPSLRSYAYESDCRGFWKCENGVSVGNCCPRGQAYKPDIGCRRDPNCNTTCDSREITTNCDKRALKGNPSKFEQLIHGDQYVQMDCPPGLVFVNEICKCDYRKSEPVPTQETVCKKELDLDFQAGVKDISGNNVHVEAFNVTIHNGIACFYGDGALVVPRFANVDLGKRIQINIRYFLHNPYSKHKGRQALLYNGDCDLTSTMVVAVDSDGSYFGMSNDRGFYKHVAVENNSKKRWIEAKYSLHSNLMKVIVNGIEKSTTFYGSIARSRCGLKIGWGQDFESFEGCIDKISISFCPPEKV